MNGLAEVIDRDRAKDTGIQSSREVIGHIIVGLSNKDQEDTNFYGSGREINFLESSPVNYLGNELVNNFEWSFKLSLLTVSR